MTEKPPMKLKRLSRAVCRVIPCARLFAAGAFSGGARSVELEVVDPFDPLGLKFVEVEVAEASDESARLTIEGQAVECWPFPRSRGLRWGFTCPCCGRRCKVLFSPLQHPWRCQQCWRVPPPSQERCFSRAPRVGRRSRLRRGGSSSSLADAG